MADTKISALPASAGLVTTDIFPVVDDPSGTPVTQKATVAQLRAAIVPIVLTADVSGTLPVANGGTGITSLGTGVATWLATPSSANLATAVTDETGSGALVFANTPTLTTPVIGAATGTSLLLSGALTVGAQMTGNSAVSSPYSAHGVAGHTFASDADYTVLAAQYASDYNYFATGSWASGHTVTYPAAPSNQTYYKTIENRTSYDMTLTASGSVVTRVLPAGYTVRVVVTENSDLKFIGAPFHMTVGASGSLALPDSAGTAHYKFAVSDLAADRTVTLPLLTGNDTFVFEAHAATLTNKTISLGSNTVTCTSAQLATACSDETGSGALVFATSPTLVTPVIGAATGTSLALSSYMRLGAASPYATVGDLRLANRSTAYTRGVSDDKNLTVFQTDENNKLWLGGDNVQTSSSEFNQTAIQASTTIWNVIGANVKSSMSADGIQFGSSILDFGGGTGVIGLDNAATNPTTNPTAGGILFSTAGALHWRGSSGTDTAVAPAEPHCPKCGTDVGIRGATNDLFGEEYLFCPRCEKRTGNGVVLDIANIFERKVA